LVWTNNTPEIPSFEGTKKEPTLKCKSTDSQTIKSNTVKEREKPT